MDKRAFFLTSEKVWVPQTTDITGDGTASADSIYNTNYYAAYAFDNNLNTCWQSGQQNTAWLQVLYPTSRRVWKYRMYQTTDLAFAPTAWYFRGSTDNFATSNVILDTQSGWNMTPATWYDFTISVPGDYTTYRWDITATYNGSYPLLWEGEMYEMI